MNQQIRELALQAGLGIQHNGIVLTRNVNAAEAFEQFAKSIVRECMQVTVNYPHPQTKLTASEHIARHFGVEL